MAIFWSIKTVSIALQTAGREVLALRMIFVANSKSANSSTNTWQIPTPVSITGTELFSTTRFIKPAPPRGMITSTYLFKRIITSTASCSVMLTN